MEESPDDDQPFGTAMAIGSETTEAEKEYERVLEDLRNAEGLKLYSDVYTKLFDSYFKLKDSNNHLKSEIHSKEARIGRFDEILNEHMAELNTANKTIKTLRQDLAEAKALADAMHIRELASVESLETIKTTLAKVEKELDARKRAGDDDAGATSAAKEKEKFEKEKARLQGEVDSLRLRLNNALSFQEELEQRNNNADETIAKLEENLEEADNSAVRQNRLVEHLNVEISNFREELETRGVQISGLNEKLSKTEKSLEKRDKQVKDLSSKIETAHREQENAIARAIHFRESYENLHKEFEKNKTELANTKRDLKNALDDAHKVRAESSKLNKSYLNCMKKYQLLEHSKADLDNDRERLRQVVGVMEREINLGKKQAEADKRDIENLQREKDILNKSMQKIQMEAMENLHMIHLQEHRRKQLEHEIDLNLAQITKQRLLIRQLENDKDRMLEEAIALNEKIDEITDEVRLRTADILDLNKALRDEGAKCRKLSSALDDCRAERNMLHKNYTESLDEIQDLKQKLKMLAYQIEQLKEDISGKETGLKRCEATLSKCHKRTEQLKGEIQSLHVKLSDAKGDITALRQEEARLNRIIQEGDAARQKLKKELESLMNERDVIGAQLVRRNDEISLLYEKIRILEVTLHRGERQYEQKRDDIRLLRLEIIRLRKEKNLLSKGIENMTDLRLEVFNIERELGRERLRVRALEEALETPLNVHRWRKLQGTDPESVHLTQKLRLLQKKVLSQSETIIFKDRELKETKNLYKAVQDMLALQPSPEIQQTLTKTQRALAQRTTKIKCLIAEVNMRERQVTDLRLEMDKITTELNSYKQKYYELKRALDADEARRLRLPTPITPEPDGIKT